MRSNPHPLHMHPGSLLGESSLGRPTMAAVNHRYARVAASLQGLPSAGIRDPDPARSARCRVEYQQSTSYPVGGVERLLFPFVFFFFNEAPPPDFSPFPLPAVLPI